MWRAVAYTFRFCRGRKQSRRRSGVASVLGRRAGGGPSGQHAHNVSAVDSEPNLQTVRAMITVVCDAFVCARCLRSNKVVKAADRFAAHGEISSVDERADRDRVPYHRVGGMAAVVCLGSGSVRSATGAMVDGDDGAQTRRVLLNVRALVRASGLTMANIVRTTVFLADVNDFAAMNEVYKVVFLRAPRPVDRSGAARLPRDSRIGNRRSPPQTSSSPNPARYFQHICAFFHDIRSSEDCLLALEKTLASPASAGRLRPNSASARRDDPYAGYESTTPA